MGNGDWKTTIFDKDGNWHGTTRDVGEMARENTRELWRRMHDTGGNKKLKEPTTKEEKTKMKNIVYVFAQSVTDSHTAWTTYWLHANGKRGVGVSSLKEVAKQLIDEVDNGCLAGDIYIITRPPDELLVSNNESKDCRALSGEEQEKFRRYFNIKRIVG